MAKLRIKELCKARGMQLKDLAEVLGVSPSAVSQAIKSPSYVTLEKVSEALKVNISELFENDYDVVQGVVSINGKTYPISSKQDIENLLTQLR